MASATFVASFTMLTKRIRWAGLRASSFFASSTPPVSVENTMSSKTTSGWVALTRSSASPGSEASATTFGPPRCSKSSFTTSRKIG